MTHFQNQLSGETPSAPVTESDVLGCCLSEGTGWWELVVRVSGNDPESLFNDPTHRVIARAIERANNTDSGVTPASVEDHLLLLGGDSLALEPRQFLVQLQANASITTLGNLNGALSTLVNKRSLRNQLSEIETTRQHILNLNVSPTDVSSELRRISMDHVINRKLRQAEDVIDELEQVENAPWSVPTGITQLDKLFGGGYEPGRLYIIGARPKVGKTTLALSNALRAVEEQNVVVLFVSLEMSERELYAKMLSNLSGIPHSTTSQLVNRTIRLSDLSPEDAEELQEARQELRESKLHMAFERDIIDGADSIISMMMHLRAKYGDSVRMIVIVDYIQLMVRDNYNRRTEVGYMSRTLKLASANLNMPVVALSQINRSGADVGMPAPWQLQESGNIEQDADGVILAHRKNMDGDPENPEPAHLMDIKVALNRSGPPGYFQVNCAMDISTVTSLEDQFEERTDRVHRDEYFQERGMSYSDTDEDELDDD